MAYVVHVPFPTNSVLLSSFSSFIQLPYVAPVDDLVGYLDKVYMLVRVRIRHCIEDVKTASIALISSFDLGVLAL